MGAVFKIPTTYVSDIVNTVLEFKKTGRRIFSAELSSEAVALDKINFISSDAIVIGNEGHGVSSEVSKACDGGVYIPISRNTESLNASVAAAILMWELNKG